MKSSLKNPIPGFCRMDSQQPLEIPVSFKAFFLRYKCSFLGYGYCFQLMQQEKATCSFIMFKVLLSKQMSCCAFVQPKVPARVRPQSLTVLKVHQLLLSFETELGIQRQHKVTFLHLDFGDLSVFRVMSCKEKCNGHWHLL